MAPPVESDDHWAYVLVVLLFVLFMVILIAAYFVIRRLHMLKIPDEKLVVLVFSPIKCAYNFSDILIL